MATLKNTTINDTGFLKLPSGTDAQRPGTPEAGMMRWNTTSSGVEVYDGTAWGSVGGGSDATTLQGYSVSSLINDTHSTFSQGNLPVGWYTIATNSGNRAVARFGIRDTQSSRHQTAVFYASHNYGSFSEITLLHSSRFSGNPFRYIRIKEGSTYDGAMLQVYIDDAGNYVNAYLLGDNFQFSGWVLKDWVPDGTDPGGLGNFAGLTNTAAQIDINQVLDGGMVTTGEIYAGGNTTQYKVWHEGNLSLSSTPILYTFVLDVLPLTSVTLTHNLNTCKLLFLAYRYCFTEMYETEINTFVRSHCPNYIQYQSDTRICVSDKTLNSITFCNVCAGSDGRWSRLYAQLFGF